jgi:alpha-1,6-mannosyltransferase
MIFLDICTFYYGSDGGVKSFYNAKIEWFKKHPEHQYYLVFPSPHQKIEKIAQNVRLIKIFGLKGIIGKDRLLLVNYWRILRHIHKIKPDVIEVGDPLLSPFFISLASLFGFFKGILSCFHHSDPVNSYLRPWVYGKRPSFFKRIIEKIMIALYRFSHKRFTYSLVPSQDMKRRLSALGIKNIKIRPHGIKEIFFSNAYVRKKKEKHLLYVGRLEAEKGIRLFKKVLSQILDIKDVRVTVMGKGIHEPFFREFKHPAYQYLGYIEDVVEVESIYHRNNILLAPGPYESFGIAVVEALANGMIVVGPDKGGTSELLSTMNSPFVFKSGCAKSFLETIKKVLDCDFEKESLRSIRHARNFGTWETAFDGIIDFYHEEILKQNKKTNEQESLDFIT